MQTAKTTVSTTIPTTIPHRLLSGEGHRNPSTTSKLLHTWGTTMNNEEKLYRWIKQKEERSSNRFLERNGEDRRRLALVSLLFSSLLFLSLSPLFSRSGHGKGRRREGRRLRVHKRNVLDEIYATAVSICPIEQWIQKVNFSH